MPEPPRWFSVCIFRTWKGSRSSKLHEALHEESHEDHLKPHLKLHLKLHLKNHMRRQSQTSTWLAQLPYCHSPTLSSFQSLKASGLPFEVLLLYNIPIQWRLYCENDTSQPSLLWLRPCSLVGSSLHDRSPLALGLFAHRMNARDGMLALVRDRQTNNARSGAREQRQNPPVRQRILLEP